MGIRELLISEVKKAVAEQFDAEPPSVELQPTRKGFDGDTTVVLFPLLKLLKTSPDVLGKAIGDHLVENTDSVSGYNVIQGFLNLELSDGYFLKTLNSIPTDGSYGTKQLAEDNKAVIVEYSSPNTNKPLHLGHIRNCLLGYSVAEILKAAGHKVYKTQIINDRGIHICKSMLAWKRYGNNATPESTETKGDKLVGDYYVKFDQQYKGEIRELVAAGKTEEEAKKEAPSIIAAQELLRKWEAGDQETVALWKQMNGWVYDGFDVTYRVLGVDFDKNYYESDTYLLGKKVVAEGLKKGVFYKKDDGSVWIDLTDEGLDEKIVLRADGTAVYMTQDIGTAIQRVKDYPDVGGMVYTVGNEQDYHFKVLFLILKKLGYAWANHLFHLSYGMVDLPSGKMKSREGTVVDADDLITEMAQTAKAIADELGKLEGYTDPEKKELYNTIGLGALKYFILKVDPRKRMVFNPEESVDFQGNTGPFIQYTYARIQSVLRKYTGSSEGKGTGFSLKKAEKEIIKLLDRYPEIVSAAAENHSPALVANYAYELVKAYNTFYQAIPILSEADEPKRAFRVELSEKTGTVIASAMALFGIGVPERM